MRKSISFILVVVLVASLFVGCSKSNETNKTLENDLVDKYTTTYATEVKTLNPFLLLDTTALRVAANTMDGLVENDRFGRYVPSLAKSWEHNDDYTVWSFKLREGLKWVDYQGNETEYEVTADDFVEGMRYIADPTNGIKNVSIIRKVILGLNNYYWDLVDIDDGVNIGKTREEVLDSFDSSVGVKAIDNYTVEYTLEAPTPFFLSYLVTEMFFPVEKTFLDNAGEDFGTTKEKLLFNGSYYLSDWQRDKSISLKKNEFYWDKDNVKVKDISLQKVSDDSITVQMFQRGELSSALLKGDQVKALQGTDWEKYIYLREKSSVTFWFAMNFTSDNPEFNVFINNKNFRKALYHGIDRAKLLELYNPYEPEVLLRNTIIPEEVVIDNNGTDYTDYPELKVIKESQTYNPDLAKEYMKKAIKELCDENGNIKGVSQTNVDILPIAEFTADGKLPVQMVYIHSTDSTDTKLALLLAQMLKDTLGEENIELVLGQYVDDKYNDTIEPRRFDMLYDSFSFKYADPMAQLARLVTDGGVNDGQYSDEYFDNLVYEADEITNLEERYAKFSKAEAHMIDNVYIIPWQSGGGSYTMSKVVPFTYPRGGFGVTRFKYKGMIVEKEPITAERYNELHEKFKTDMKEALEGSN